MSQHLLVWHEKYNNPKNSFEGSKKCKKGPIAAESKTKDWTVLSTYQSCNSFLFKSQLFRVC